MTLPNRPVPGAKRNVCDPKWIRFRLAPLFAAVILVGIPTGCGDDAAADNDDARPPRGVDAQVGRPDVASSACGPGGIEICDGLDNDCNGQIDEIFDLAADIEHCGACDHRCDLNGAVPTCLDGTCIIKACEAGAADADGDPDNGCEARCALVPGDEICDGEDNDCDGEIDEGVDPHHDVNNCGRCNHVCEIPHGVPACQDGQCVLQTCEPGFGDFDGDLANGCEATCTPDRPGIEICDGEDNDCDAEIDEGFDPQTDGENCGRCQHRCAFANAGAQCIGGACHLAACDVGFVDADREAANGCETRCEPTSHGVEICDEIDNDCNGIIDDGFDTARDPDNCGGCSRLDDAHRCRLPNAITRCVDGACEIEQCELGFADGDDEASNGCERPCGVEDISEELCDGVDNDCDGLIDEEFDLITDAEHCGACNARCFTANAEPGCERGRCVIGRCPDGMIDLDRIPNNGCEYLCTPAPDPTEICDLIDNNCDGQIDEGFDIFFDVGNCGGCNRACAPDHAFPVCINGRCDIGQCDPGWVDANRDLRDGCELECAPSPDAIEICNGQDDDCDGVVDNGFNLLTNPDHCGECNHFCAVRHGRAQCSDGTCAPAGCQPGWVDANGDLFGGLDGEPSDGCEYPCTATANPTEICDGLDNDCDGVIDNDFDLDSLAHCGACDITCRFAHARTECQEGICRLAACDEGFIDSNRNPLDGCETPCLGDADAPEICNGVDDDCDGLVDEGFDLQSDGQNCGQCDTICGLDNAETFCNAGQCDVLACADGFVNLDGEPDNGCECVITEGGVEICDGIDNDCNGIADDADQVVPPPEVNCRVQGVCLGTRPACIDAGWTCVYPDTYQVEENLCDGMDNDCDGERDEGHIGLGTPCAAGVGACREQGSIVCNASRDGVKCSITEHPERSTQEVCNGLDDDCDGEIDEDGDWLVGVPAGDGVDAFEIYAYEASRTDADATTSGTSFSRACSKPQALPWVNVDHETAASACANAGLGLCSAAQWERACAGDAHDPYPYGLRFDSRRCNGQAHDANPAQGGNQDHAVPTGSLPACHRAWPPGRTYDQSGNVWEWTADVLGDDESARALRGGSYGNIAGGLTCQFTNAAPVDAHRENIGFRCCSAP